MNSQDETMNFQETRAVSGAVQVAKRKDGLVRLRCVNGRDSALDILMDDDDARILAAALVEAVDHYPTATD